MTWLIVASGALIAALGLVGLVQPARFRSVFGAMDSQSRFIMAVVIRLLMGALLWWVAGELRHPQVMRVIAAIAIVAAVVILIAGRTRLDRLIDWWLGKPDGVLRVSALFAGAFGFWLAWEAL